MITKHDNDNTCSLHNASIQGVVLFLLPVGFRAPFIISLYVVVCIQPYLAKCFDE